MTGYMRVSSPGDPLIGWESRLARSENFSSNLYESVESTVLSAQEKMSSLVSAKTFKRCIYKPIYTASSIVKRICEITYEFFSSIEDCVEMMIGKMWKFEGSVKLLKIASIPFSLVNLVYNCYLCIYGRGAEKVDAALQSVDELASIIGSTAVFCMGLEALGAITSKVSNWLTPIALTATVFSSVSILIHMRRYRKMEKIGRQLDRVVDLTAKAGAATLKDYGAFLDVFEKRAKKHPSILNDCFHFKDAAIKKRLVDIECIAQEMLSSSSKETQQEGRALLYRTMQVLRDRIDHNMTSSVLAGVSAAIGIIGSVVFFACPALPAGIAISGIGAALGGMDFIYQRVADHQLMKQIGLERKWYEWITC